MEDCSPSSPSPASRPVVVQKYGGSSLATLEKIQAVAQRIADTVADGYRVVAVVSAMGKTTDGLLAQARALSPNPVPRELDMLLSTGERVSTALLGIALGAIGHDAVSLTGSQSGIITNTRHNRARIVEVRPFRVLDLLDEGKVVIVAGYQGVSYTREITTLGRGGTDTTAVAIAAAVGAEWCEICSDVDGVYTADPRLAPDAQRLESLSHEAMIALAREGSKVLAQDCVEHASRQGVAIFAKATFKPRDDAGTVVRTNPAPMPTMLTAIAHRDRILEVETAPDADVAALYRALVDANAMPHALAARPGEAIHALIPLENVHRRAVLEQMLGDALPGGFRLRDDRGTVTLVGPGLGETPEITMRALAIAREVCGAAVAFDLGALTLRMLIDGVHVGPLVAALHKAFFPPAG
jgi:aspartate kinase